MADLQKKLRGMKILSVALAAALVFVGGSYASLVFGPGGAQGANAQLPEQQAQVVDTELIAAEPYMVLGADDAPVTLYEWTDYTCPYCGVFNRETLPDLIEEYVDSGKVRIELHDVTYIGPQAEDAATAARAAGLQDRYFDYLFAVYELGANDNNPDLSRNALFEIASNLGLDLTQFESDFDSEELRQGVQLKTQLAQSLGVSGVPFFLATETGSLEGAGSLNGAHPIEQFRVLLDEQLELADS